MLRLQTQIIPIRNPPPKRRGLLILFEGGNAVGKTTQAHLLQERILGAKQFAQYFKFPASMDRESANYLFEMNQRQEYGKIQWLYVCQRRAAWQEMNHLLTHGVNIIVDRYSFSGLVYSHAVFDNFEENKQNENQLLEPDILFLLDTTTPGVNKEKYVYHHIEEETATNFGGLIVEDTHIRVTAIAQPDADYSRKVQQTFRRLIPAYVQKQWQGRDNVYKKITTSSLSVAETSDIIWNIVQPKLNVESRPPIRWLKFDDVKLLDVTEVDE